jgi:hypothetical protein
MQIAQILTGYETFGKTSFDRAFTASELAFGNFGSIPNSLVNGNPVPLSKLNADTATFLSRGRMALVGAAGGVTGVIPEGIRGRLMVRSKINRNNNFTVVSVSEAAGRELMKMKSFDAVNVMANQLWELAQELPRGVAIDWASQRKKESEIPEAVRQAGGNALIQLRRITSHPVMTGVQVFVHPYGMANFGDLFLYSSEENPNFPYAVSINYWHLNQAFYTRFQQDAARSCGR